MNIDNHLQLLAPPSSSPNSKLEGISKAVVTGGAGFIGSHLVDRLCDLGISVTVVDNLSASGSMENIEEAVTGFPNTKKKTKKDIEFLKADLKSDSLECFSGSDIVFHLAGNPEVKIGYSDTSIDFNENILATYRVLEATKKYKIPKFVFTSTSTVYGEPSKIPTPEDYSPLIPISTYGGSKLSCEALIASFSNLFKIHSTVYRFANVTGSSRSRHGVVFDFVNKLRTNPKKLEILGDGTQSKSYIDIEDCVDAMLFVLSSSFSSSVSSLADAKVESNSTCLFDVFNLGSLDTIDVMSIAKIVSEELKLNPQFITTGGVDGGRGWKGDVKVMRLDISKIMRLGWKPRYSSAETITRATRSLVDYYDHNCVANGKRNEEKKTTINNDAITVRS
jgi:UDP-glucose 4-epimerase